MKNLKEKQLLVNMARALGQAPDPSVVRELEFHASLQDRMRSSIRENFLRDFGVQAQRLNQIDQAKQSYPMPPSALELGLVLDDAIALMNEVRAPSMQFPLPPALEDLDKIPLNDPLELSDQNLQELTSLIDRTSAYIAAEAERAGVETAAVPDIHAQQIQELQKKLRYLEQWVGRIAAGGAPGSGEVRVLRMDDVNAAARANGRVLVWNEATQKLQFGSVSDIAGTTSAVQYLYYPSAGQTVFAGADHYGSVLGIPNPDYVSLYLNGVKLIKTVDYVPQQDRVELLEGAPANSVIEIVTLDVPQESTADTLHVVSGNSSSYTALITDTYIGVAATPNTAVTITLPAVPAGRKITVKDEGGAAAVNHITVQSSAGAVENNGNVIMTANGMSLQFIYNGTDWFIV